MKIIGLFLNNEIRTGGHTRYLELLSGIGAKGHLVTLYRNSFLNRNVEHVSPISVPFRYTWKKTRFLGMRIKNSFCVRYAQGRSMQIGSSYSAKPIGLPRRQYPVDTGFQPSMRSAAIPSRKRARILRSSRPASCVGPGFTR